MIKVLLFAIALGALTESALAQDRVYVHPSTDQNELPYELRQRVDRTITGNVLRDTTPVHRQKRVFVPPHSDPNELPDNLRGSRPLLR